MTTTTRLKRISTTHTHTQKQSNEYTCHCQVSDFFRSSNKRNYRLIWQSLKSVLSAAEVNESHSIICCSSRSNRSASGMRSWRCYRWTDIKLFPQLKQKKKNRDVLDQTRCGSASRPFDRQISIGRSKRWTSPATAPPSTRWEVFFLPAHASEGLTDMNK